MAQHYQADQYVTNNGPTGNGCSWEYDKKTKKYGIKYSDGDFYPAADEKQPGYQASYESSQPSVSSGPSGPSDFDRIWEKNMDEIRQASAAADKQFFGFVKVLFGSVIAFAAGKTFAKSMEENPDDMPGAVKNSLRTVACGSSIAGVFLLLCVLTVIILFTAPLWGPVGATIIKIIFLFGVYSIYGFIRVAKGKSFWIGVKNAPNVIRSIKIPKIGYVAIELAVTALLTKPILTWINSFTIEWAKANQDTASTGLVLALGLGMLLISIALAAVAGLLVCKLLKWITGGN